MKFDQYFKEKLPKNRLLKTNYHKYGRISLKFTYKVIITFLIIIIKKNLIKHNIHIRGTF